MIGFNVNGDALEGPGGPGSPTDPTSPNHRKKSMDLIHSITYHELLVDPDYQDYRVRLNEKKNERFYRANVVYRLRLVVQSKNHQRMRK